MLATIRTINKLSRDAGITSTHLLNFCVSDGETVVATRYASPGAPATLDAESSLTTATSASSAAAVEATATSLFFSSGTTFEEYAPGGHYRMVRADKR